MLCSLCKINQAREDGKYCLNCHAEYERKYRHQRLTRALARAFCEGADAMRADLVARFEKVGLEQMNGATAAHIAKTQTIPRFALTLHEAQAYRDWEKERKNTKAASPGSA